MRPANSPLLFLTYTEGREALVVQKYKSSSSSSTLPDVQSGDCGARRNRRPPWLGCTVPPSRQHRVMERRQRGEGHRHTHKSLHFINILCHTTTPQTLLWLSPQSHPFPTLALQSPQVVRHTSSCLRLNPEAA